MFLLNRSTKSIRPCLLDQTAGNLKILELTGGYVHSFAINTCGKRMKLRLSQRETHRAEIGRKVRQEFFVSLIFFNLFGEYLLKEALAEVGDFKIEGR